MAFRDRQRLHMSASAALTACVCSCLPTMGGPGAIAYMRTDKAGYQKTAVVELPDNVRVEISMRVVVGAPAASPERRDGSAIRLRFVDGAHAARADVASFTMRLETPNGSVIPLGAPYARGRRLLEVPIDPYALGVTFRAAHRTDPAPGPALVRRLGLTMTFRYAGEPVHVSLPEIEIDYAFPM